MELAYIWSNNTKGQKLMNSILVRLIVTIGVLHAPVTHALRIFNDHTVGELYLTNEFIASDTGSVSGRAFSGLTPGSA